MRTSVWPAPPGADANRLARYLNVTLDGVVVARATSADETAGRVERYAMPLRSLGRTGPVREVVTGVVVLSLMPSAPAHVRQIYDAMRAAEAASNTATP